MSGTGMWDELLDTLTVGYAKGGQSTHESVCVPAQGDFIGLLMVAQHVSQWFHRSHAHRAVLVRP